MNFNKMYKDRQGPEISKIELYSNWKANSRGLLLTFQLQ